MSARSQSQVVSQRRSRSPAYKVARRGITRTFQISSEFAALTVLENLLVAAPSQRGEALWQAALGKGSLATV